MQGGEEGSGALGIASGDTAPSLEVKDGIFYQMAQLIEMFVIVARRFSVAARWNLSLHLLPGGLLHDGVAVVAFVCDQVFGSQSLNQRASRCAIRHGTRCNKDSDRHTMRIHGQMQLGVEPPFVRPIA